MAILRSKNKPHSFFMDEVVELGLEEAVVLQIIRDIIYNESVEKVTTSMVLEVIPYFKNCIDSVLHNLVNRGKLINEPLNISVDKEISYSLPPGN
jgi:hypothetical protein